MEISTIYKQEAQLILLRPIQQIHRQQKKPLKMIKSKILKKSQGIKEKKQVLKGR